MLLSNMKLCGNSNTCLPRGDRVFMIVKQVFSSSVLIFAIT